MLVQFWSRLRGSVHPDDAATFAAYGTDHAYNLDFPPPAYWGDVVNAPVLILDNNGGYDPGVTPREFESANAAERHRQRLREPAPLNLADAPVTGWAK